MLTDADASGGAGSFSKDIWGLLTGAVETVGMPYIAKELGLISTTSANGDERYAAAPTQPTPKQAVSNALANPLLWICGAAVVIGLVMLVRRA